MKDELKFKYSPDVDALWIDIQEGKVDDTIEIAQDLFVDFDEHKNILSIEMLDASRLLKFIES
jgi:uncharacterized protein YuzE